MDFSQDLTQLIGLLSRLGFAVLIVVAFWIMAKINRGVVKRFGLTRHLSHDIVKLSEQLTEVTLLVFGLITAFGTLGVDVGAMIASLGLVGFALGFALKDLLSNLLSGLLILIYNPFVRGDVIQVAPNEGKVVEINLRYTVLEAENKRIMIPNSTLFSNPVIVQRQSVETKITDAVKE